MVERAGCSALDDQRFDWEDKDVFTVPTWTFCELVNGGDDPAFSFTFSGAPVMKALSLYREQTGSQLRAALALLGPETATRRRS